MEQAFRITNCKCSGWQGALEWKELSNVLKLPLTFMKCYNRIKKRPQLECILEFKMHSLEIPELFQDNRKLILVMLSVGKLALKD